MRETTREIFEKHEIRKTKEQKKIFREYLLGYARSLGYDARVEQAGKNVHNVIVGDPKSARVVYTAHYDTCAVMPFPNLITPKNVGLYLLYQLVLSIFLYIIPFSIMIGSRHVFNVTGSNALFLLLLLGGYALILAVTYLMMAGPANKHTANDNTSGVTTLIDIMTDMPGELRGDVAYIFFDLEELGLKGSKGYAARHKTLKKKMIVLNFDCVSDGQHVLFAVKKKANDLADKIAEAFPPSNKYSVTVATKGVFYPSDQMCFDRGIAVSVLNKTKRGIMYMDKIHTKHDTVYDEENIEFLKAGAIEFVRVLRK